MTQTPAPVEPIARRRFARTAAPGWGVLCYRILVTGLSAGGIIVQHGFRQPPLPGGATDWLQEHFGVYGFVHLIHVVQGLLLALYLGDVFVRPIRGEGPEAHSRIDWMDYAMLAAACAGVGLGLFTGIGWGWMVFKLVLLWAFLAELWRLQQSLVRHVARPGMVLPLSFLLLIGMATVLLKLPVARPPEAGLTWLDSLFTATSAVCVTGLVVHNTAEHFTPVGQAIIGAFIQLGGLGIILFGSLVAVLLGRSMSLKERLNLSQMMDDLPLHRLHSMVAFVVFSTIIIEAAGALLLLPLWEAPPGASLSWQERAGQSIFHAVSAYCNAGFDITGASLVPYRYSALTHLVIAPLIVLGGLGYPVLINLVNIARYRITVWWRPRRPGSIETVDLSRRRLSLHSKMVLLMTLGLYLYGFVALAASFIVPRAYEQLPEPAEPLNGWEAVHVLADASFMSVTARTAGFNSIPMEALDPAGIFTLITLMFVGGSPGGTAGGVKTAVVGVLMLSVLSTLRQRRETEAFNRTLADSLVRKAATVLICYAGMIAVGTLLLLMSEPFGFVEVVFEAVSAATTTGLSLGVTPGLTPFGKVVIIAMMFLGRVGPLALLGALVFTRGPQRPYAYPHENVALG